MADQFGTQGGFEGLSGAAEKFEKGTGLFKTTVGEWTFGVVALTKALAPSSEKLKGASDTLFKLTGVLRDVSQAFTAAKVVDVIADLSTSMHDTKKSLQRTFGLFGDDNKVILESIRTQSQLTNKYGIRMRENLDSFKSLQNQFQSLGFGMDLVSATSEVTALFGIASEASAQIVFGLNKFGGLDKSGIGEFMDGVSEAALSAGLSSTAVAENMSSSAKFMHRFQLDTKAGSNNFKKMLISSTKMGKTVGEMTTDMDAFRTIPGAIEGSLTASLAGLNITAGELLVSARGGDKTVLTDRVMDRLDTLTDQQGRLSSFGVDIASQLGPLVNMSVPELQQALARRNDPELLAQFMANNVRLEKQQGIMEKLDNTLYKTFEVIQPFADFFLSIVEAIVSHTKITQAILGGSLVYWAWSKGGGTAKAVASGMSKWGGVGGTFNALRDKNYGGGMGKANSMGRLKYMLGLGGEQGGDDGLGGGRGKQPRRANGQFGTGMSPKQMAAQSKQMLAGAVGMVAFASAMWILSKALNNFNTVEWDSVKKAGVIMFGFSTSMILIGKTLTANFQSLLALSVAMLAVGAGMMGIGIAAKLIGETNLVNVGIGLVALSGGLLALMGVGALMSTGLGAVFAGIGLASVIATIAGIGLVAMKFASPIETMSLALERLATAMVTLKDVGYSDVKFDIDKSSLQNLEKVSIALAGNKASERIVVESHTTLNIDGKKFMRALSKSEEMG
ncbi:MAG: hypothetical protein KUG81_06240 [Gammaproteobacteria bacterium]|nr:hypothetical protein [Gammaproteobacteria bacterium]